MRRSRPEQGAGGAPGGRCTPRTGPEPRKQPQAESLRGRKVPGELEVWASSLDRERPGRAAHPEDEAGPWNVAVLDGQAADVPRAGSGQSESRRTGGLP